MMDEAMNCVSCGTALEPADYCPLCGTFTADGVAASADAEERGRAARQAEIVAWLRREAVGGALGPAALLSWAADQIEGGVK